MNVRKAIRRVAVPAPAKINLFLAITGKRSDSFHEILSVVSKINLFDLVTLEQTNQSNELSCLCPENPSLANLENLACVAVKEWRKFTGDKTGFRINLKKKIPVMAGMGGGSSDAVATLKALNIFHGHALSETQLIELASRIGSDCPLFFKNGLIAVEGRGEIVNSISPEKNNEWKGKPILIFQPNIEFSTSSMYGLLAKNESYSDSNWAKSRFERWKNGPISGLELCHNDFESVIFKKYLFIEPLFTVLKEKFDLTFHVSGSGSCCFCFINDEADFEVVKKEIKRCLGEHTKFWISQIL